MFNTAATGPEPDGAPMARSLSVIGAVVTERTELMSSM